MLYIYTALPRLQVSLDARPLCPTPDRHQATQAHPTSQQGHSRLEPGAMATQLSSSNTFGDMRGPKCTVGGLVISDIK